MQDGSPTIGVATSAIMAASIGIDSVARVGHHYWRFLRVGVRTGSIVTIRHLLRPAVIKHIPKVTGLLALVEAIGNIDLSTVTVCKETWQEGEANTHRNRQILREVRYRCQ